MDFQLTEEHRAIQDMVCDFTEKEIAPRAADIDKNDEYPADVFEKMGQQGLPVLVLQIPSGRGG